MSRYSEMPLTVAARPEFVFCAKVPDAPLKVVRRQLYEKKRCRKTASKAGFAFSGISV